MVGGGGFVWWVRVPERRPGCSAGCGFDGGPAGGYGGANDHRGGRAVAMVVWDAAVVAVWFVPLALVPAGMLPFLWWARAVFG